MKQHDTYGELSRMLEYNNLICKQTQDYNVIISLLQNSPGLITTVSQLNRY